MKLNVKTILFFSLIIGSLIAAMMYRQSLKATLIGQYRGEGYNFFAQLYTFDSNFKLVENIVPESLKQSCAENGITLNTIAVSCSLVLWGNLIDPALAPNDRTYNVVFHPDVLGWRNNNADFNITILAGLFDPNGVKAAANDSIAINQLAPINVHKHDQIFYSPNNARFQFQSDRRIATFWTMGISEDKTKATITFNILIDEPTYQNSLSTIISNSQSEDPNVRNAVVLESLENIAPTISNDADKKTLDHAIAHIRLSIPSDYF